MINIAVCHGKPDGESKHTYFTGLVYFYVGEDYFEVAGSHGTEMRHIRYDGETAVITVVSEWEVELARNGKEVIDL